MSFTDRAQIHVQAGRGGNGCLSFRREAHSPKGGPDGGNGGRGGDVVLVADEQMIDLTQFRHAVHHKATVGGDGEGRNKHGRNGGDLEVSVPPGTRVFRDDEEIAVLGAVGDRVSVARGGGRTSYRGLVQILEGAHGSKSTVRCDALLVDDISRSDTYPYVDVREDDVSMGHEATVSKVSADQLFYLMSRGMKEDEAMAMIVRGFVEPIARELPMEYALELNRLIELQMEGAVG